MGAWMLRYRVMFFCAWLLSSVISGPAWADIALTTEEQQWLAEHGDQVVLLFDKYYPPIEYLDEDGSFKGFGADLISLIEQRLGVVFKKSPAPSWSEELAALKNGDAQIAPVIVRSEERAKYASFSKPYLSLPVVVISRRDRPDADGLLSFRGQKVATVKGYVSEAFLRNKYAGQFEIALVNSTAEGLRDVAFGVADAFVENIATAAYYIEREKLPNLRIVGNTTLYDNLSFAVNKNYPLLFSSMQKALNDIAPRELASLKEKWIPLDDARIMSPEQKEFLFFALSASLFILAGMMIIAWMLKRGLKSKEKKLLAVESALKEQSDRLNLSIQGARAALWDLYPQTGKAFFSDEWYAMLGYKSGEVDSSLEGWASLTDPRDVESTRKILDDYLSGDGQGQYEAQFRMRAKTGEWRWVLGKGRTVEWDAKGRPYRLIGMNFDIQEQKEIEEALRKSEAISSALFNQAFNFIGLLDLEGNILRINRSAQDTLHFEDNLIGASFWDAPWWPDKKLAGRIGAEAMSRAMRGEIYRSEVTHINRSGEERIIDMAFSPLKTDEGEVVYFIPEGRDITEIKKALKTIEKSEQRFKSIFDNAPYSIVINSFEDGNYLDVNNTFLSNAGMTKAQVLTLPPDKTGALPFTLKAEERARIRHGGVFNVEAQSEKADGAVAQMLYSSVPIPYGEEEAILSMVVDITEKKQTEIALAESEKKYRDIFNNAPIGIFRTAYEGYFLEANPKLAEMFGYDSPEHIIASARNIARDIYPRSEIREEFLHELERRPSGVTKEVEFKRRDGTALYGIMHAALRYDKDGAPAFLEGTIEDITERKQATDALMASEKKFSELFMLSPDSIILSSFETDKILEVNESFLAAFGYEREELLGKSAMDLDIFVDTRRRDDFLRWIKETNRPNDFEAQLYRKDGAILTCSINHRNLEVNGQRVHMIIGRDVTEQKKIQEMMVQTEKMLSVGGMAAGIAHEINNPLGIILQTIQNVAQRIRPDFRKNIETAATIGLDMDLLRKYHEARDIPKFIDNIQSAALRAAAIIRHMLDFSRRSESNRTACDLHSIIDKAVLLAESDYDLKKDYDFKRIVLHKEYADSVEPVSCTETEIEQVILNLLRNAAQAMTEKTLPEKAPEIYIRLTQGDGRARIEIRDNGPGIPEEAQKRIFEPFFTTKPPGQGTGLGLSVSYFIITKGHNGLMRVESTEGKGTTFIIELPASGEPALMDIT